jgi:hypothetical protein
MRNSALSQEINLHSAFVLETMELCSEKWNRRRRRETQRGRREKVNSTLCDASAFLRVCGGESWIKLHSTANRYIGASKL